MSGDVLHGVSGGLLLLVEIRLAADPEEDLVVDAVHEEHVVAVQHGLGELAVWGDLLGELDLT